MAKQTHQPVYSAQFLVWDENGENGTWYVTVVCPVHDLIDEEVSWEDAKTPHHAGVIADQRHITCSHELDEQIRIESAQHEIAVAEREVKRVEALLKDTRENRAANDQHDEGDVGFIENKTKLYEWGLEQAKQQLEQIKKVNEKHLKE